MYVSFKYKEEIKTHLEEYLKFHKGINTRKKFNCLSPNHNDNKPSMNYWREKNICHCFSCNENLDIYKLIGIDFNLSSFKEQYIKCCNMFNYPVEEVNAKDKLLYMRYKEIMNQELKKEKQRTFELYKEVAKSNNR